MSSSSLLAVTRAVVAVLSGERPGPAALATVIGRSGSTPQVVGARLLLFGDRTLIGTVGGGAIEAQVIEACEATLRDGAHRRIEAHLVRDLGMCCGGAREVFIEPIEAPVRLVLVGAGHVAQAIAPLAAAIGLRLCVVDDREEQLAGPAFAAADRRAYDTAELAEALPDLSGGDYVVILTRDHARDEEALRELLRRPHRYLGMIGSRRKVHTVLARILRRERALGRPDPDLSRLRAPVGLALGGRTPAEIAVSVIAEILADRHAGSGAPMSVVSDAARVAQGAEPADEAPESRGRSPGNEP
ncbi:MAG: XdhC family protein [Nannocystaceae bacterium]